MRELPVRKPNRLKGYDYRNQGAYFVTICTHKRYEIFGQIPVGEGLALPADIDTNIPIIQLSDYGKIAENEITKIEQHYDCVFTNCFVIMPNHVHLIIYLLDNAGKAGVDAGRASPSPTLGNVIGGYKSGVSRLCGFPVWQRSFHDHIIRNEDEYNKIAAYIENNPITWKDDCFYPTQPNSFSVGVSSN